MFSSWVFHVEITNVCRRCRYARRISESLVIMHSPLNVTAPILSTICLIRRLRAMLFQLENRTAVKCAFRNIQLRPYKHSSIVRIHSGLCTERVRFFRRLDILCTTKIWNVNLMYNFIAIKSADTIAFIPIISIIFFSVIIIYYLCKFRIK